MPDSEPGRVGAASYSAERLVYLAQPPGSSEGGLTVEDVMLAIWKGRWMVLAITCLFGIAGLAYAFLATEWFRAEVTLLPSDSKSGSGLSAQLAQFGGLASLAGINVGTPDKQEPVAIIRSRGFMRQFIERNELVTTLLSDKWDVARKAWRSSVHPTPDMRDAVKYFEEKVRDVSEDKKTGLLTLSVEWKDPERAAAWANAMASQINEDMRARALKDATFNVNYLQDELRKTTVVSLQQAIGRLLESEMQKLMLARGTDEYAFRIVDRAEIPKLRSKPSRMAVVALSIVLGGMVACLVALATNVKRGGKT